MGLNIVTSGDSNYFHFLEIFERNVFKIFGTYPVIYDIGLTPEQRAKLCSDIVTITVDNDFNDFDSRGNIKTNHKANIVLDFFKNNTNGSCLLVDADTLFTGKISDDEFNNADIAITLKHYKEQKEECYCNGYLNAGVLYFSNKDSVKSFLSKWNELGVGDTTDQLALSDMLCQEVNLRLKMNYFGRISFNGLCIELLNPSIYNNVALDSGKILHFKQAARNSKMYNKYLASSKEIQFSVVFFRAKLKYVRIKRFIMSKIKYGLLLIGDL